MLQLNFLLLDNPIKIEDSTFLVLETPSLFSKAVLGIYQYDPEGALRIFDEKGKNISSSEMMVVTDILDYNPSSSVMKQVLSDIEGQLNDKIDVKNKIEELAAEIAKLFSYELLENELDLRYEPYNISKLLKAMEISIELEDISIFDKMMAIVHLFKYLAKKKLLVFLNTSAYLTVEELKSLQEYILLNNAKTLFLEPRKVEGAQCQYVMDEDYFLLKIN